MPWFLWQISYLSLGICLGIFYFQLGFICTKVESESFSKKSGGCRRKILNVPAQNC